MLLESSRVPNSFPILLLAAQDGDESSPLHSISIRLLGVGAAAIRDSQQVRVLCIHNIGHLFGEGLQSHHKVASHAAYCTVKSSAFLSNASG